MARDVLGRVKWFSLVSPNEPTVAQRYDHDVFATIAKALRLARGGAGRRGRRSQP